MIPTIGRVRSLERVLRCLEAQDYRPGHIVICASASSDIVEAIRGLVASRDIPTSLIRSDIKSSAVQRNILLETWETVHSHHSMGLFIDDDTYPASDYASRLMNLVLSDCTIGGASGITVAESHHRTYSKVKAAVARMFALHGAPASLLRSGVNIAPDVNQPDIVRADWLFACSMWRKEAVRNTCFPSDWMGYAIGEDVWFSSQVNGRWGLVVDSKAHLRIENIHSPLGFSVARDTVLHQFRIVVRRPDFMPCDLFSFCRSVVGRLGYDLYRLVRSVRVHHIAHLLGTIVGALTVVLRPISTAGNKSCHMR